MTSTAPISDVASINPKPTVLPNEGDEVAFVAMADLDETTAVAQDTERRPYRDVAKGYTPFQDGDILLAKITPCFENNKIGQARTSTKHAWGSTEFHVMRPHEGVLDDRYLLHFLRQPWVIELGELRMTGSAGQRRVPERVLDELQIPLPPIEEQRRIAAVLDTADALRAKRRHALAKLETLTQAVFIDMFGRNTDLVDTELGDVAEIQGGVQVTSKRKAYPLEVPYLRVANVYRGRLDLSEIKSIRLTDRELDRTRLDAGDLLIVEGHGNREEIGRVAVWNGAIDPCVHQNHLIRVRCDRARLVPRFAETYINSWIGRRALLRAANTTSGLNTISTSDVRAVRIPLPEMSAQEQFLAVAATVDFRREELLGSAAHVDSLFAALQQRAFRGEL